MTRNPLIVIRDAVTSAAAEILNDCDKAHSIANRAITILLEAAEEPVAWLYEVNVGGGHWSQQCSDCKPAGNEHQRNIRPLYLRSLTDGAKP